jgi:hypothetical protein
MRLTATQCLWHDTGYEWEEISEFYLNFRRKGAPFGKMCVFTPNSNSLKPRYYLPKNDRDLHNPDRVIEKYFKQTQPHQFVKLSTPAIKYDLDSFPEFTVYGELKLGATFIGYKAEVKLDGDLILKKTHTDNNLIISANSLNALNLNASVAVNELIATMKLSVDYDKNHCTFGSSIAGEFGSMSFMIKSGNQFTASCSLQKVETIFGDWKIEGQLGYDIEGTIFNNQDTQNSPVPSYNVDPTIPDDARAGLLLPSLMAIGLLF